MNNQIENKYKEEKLKSNNHNYKQYYTKKSGITLLALVITIVVLLILAGITITTTIGEDGFFNNITYKQKEQRIEISKAKIEMVVTKHITEKALNDAVTENDLFQRLIDADIAEKREDITGSNGEYEVTTKEKDVFEITIDDMGNITIVYIKTLNEKMPTLLLQTEEITTNSIKILVNVADGKEKMPKEPLYNYYIKESTQSKYAKEPNYYGTENTYTFTNLKHGTSYDIKVTLRDRANNLVQTTLNNIITKTVGEASSNLKIGNVIAEAPIWDEVTHTASVKLSTPTNLTIQWQNNAITENGWTTSNTAINLQHGDTLFARLTDGKNNGKEASVSILDGEAPELATISNLPNSTEPESTIVVNVTHRDKQSGININSCKWILNQSSERIEEENTLWNTANPFTNTNQITITVPNAPGNYYLHVLSVDAAENKKETVSSVIVVEQPIVTYKIKINAQINTYNQTMGSFPVAYSVIGKYNGRVVYDDVISASITNAGTQAIEANIPVQKNTVLTVTEIYSGANYNLVSMQQQEKILVEATQTNEFTFEHVYNYKLINNSSVSL